MANARHQSIDKTYLSIETAEARGFIHRDYIAHCLRWSHVIKRLQERKTFATARILDVGCGRELPLPSTLYSSRFIPHYYYGVDVGPINDDALGRFHSGKFPIDVFERTDVLALTLNDLHHQRITHVTCFEMIEHIEPDHLHRVLDHLKTLIDLEKGILWFSTPCWNGVDTAANHVNEMRYEALGAIFEAAGYEILSVHGTFASIRDYESLLVKTPGLADIFERLRGYYDVNFLACVFAPMFPANSRNCLWEVRPIKEPLPLQLRKFPNILKVQTPWGSSAKWQLMNRESEPHNG